MANIIHQIGYSCDFYGWQHLYVLRCDSILNLQLRSSRFLQTCFSRNRKFWTFFLVNLLSLLFSNYLIAHFHSQSFVYDCCWFQFCCNISSLMLSVPYFDAFLYFSHFIIVYYTLHGGQATTERLKDTGKGWTFLYEACPWQMDPKKWNW